MKSDFCDHGFNFPITNRIYPKLNLICRRTTRFSQFFLHFPGFSKKRKFVKMHEILALVKMPTASLECVRLALNAWELALLQYAVCSMHFIPASLLGHNCMLFIHIQNPKSYKLLNFLFSDLFIVDFTKVNIRTN